MFTKKILKSAASVQTIRPLRIALEARDFSNSLRRDGNDVDAAIVLGAANEIERLYGLLQEALNMAKKAVDVARSAA